MSFYPKQGGAYHAPDHEQQAEPEQATPPAPVEPPQEPAAPKNPAKQPVEKE